MKTLVSLSSKALRALATTALLFAAVRGQAQTQSWTTSLHDNLGSYYAWLAADCSTVFYLASAYEVDPRFSRAAYVHDVTRLGADEVVRPLVSLSVVIRPATTEPSARDLGQMRDWAARRCERAPAVFRPYPGLFLRVNAERPNEPVFRTRSVAAKQDGSFEVVLEADPLKVTADQTLRALATYSPPAVASVFRTQTDVFMRLTMTSEAMAEFIVEHYVERRCSSGRSCFKAMGLKVHCKTWNRCDETPRDVTHLKNLTHRSLARLEVQTGSNTPDAAMDEAHAELMGRFALSSFQQKSSRVIGDVTEVVLGDLKRSALATYQDEVNVERLITQDLECPLRLKNLGVALGPQVNEAFANETLRCLRKKKTDEITSEDPCLKPTAEVL